MKYVIVSGSHRQPSQSQRVAEFTQGLLRTRYPDAEVDIISLAGNPWPLWDEGIWDGDPVWTERLAPSKMILAAADALVVVSPEWNGQVPAGLKNFFLLFGGAELAHKPALIVAVSATEGGSYPVAELRMSSYKNCRLCYIPEHVILRYVEELFNEDPSDNNPERDEYLRERLAWSLELLTEYGKALRGVRESGKGFNPKFAFGM